MAAFYTLASLPYLFIDRPLVLSLVAVSIALYFFRSKLAKDPYGLFHLSLNKLPGEDPNVPPTTEWLNMGFWKVGSSQ